MTKSKFKLTVTTIAAVMAELLVPTLVPVAHAAPPQFDQVYVRPDTHKAGTATGVLICATPSTDSGVPVTGVEVALNITFPTSVAAGGDFQVNITPTNWVVDSTNLPATSTFWPGMTSGTTTASAVNGKTVRFTFSGTTGDLTGGVLYCFHITGTNTLINGGVALSSEMSNSTLWTENSNAAPNNVINQTNWATAVISNDTITVSAVVPPNFKLTISNNLDSLGTLDTGSVRSSTGRIVHIETNAKGGWITWAKDTDDGTGKNGLHSIDANYTMESGLKDATGTHLFAVGAAAFDLVPGQEGYVLDVDLTLDATGGCAVAVDAAYNSVSGVGGGRMSSAYRPIANCTGAAPATSDGDDLTLTERATIRGGTPAGSDYSDVITVVGAGNF